MRIPQNLLAWLKLKKERFDKTTRLVAVALEPGARFGLGHVSHHQTDQHVGEDHGTEEGEKVSDEEARHVEASSFLLARALHHAAQVHLAG